MQLILMQVAAGHSDTFTYSGQSNIPLKRDTSDY